MQILNFNSCFLYTIIFKPHYIFTELQENYLVINHPLEKIALRMHICTFKLIFFLCNPRAQVIQLQRRFVYIIYYMLCSYASTLALIDTYCRMRNMRLRQNVCPTYMQVHVHQGGAFPLFERNFPRSGFVQIFFYLKLIMIIIF